MSRACCSARFCHSSICFPDEHVFMYLWIAFTPRNNENAIKFHFNKKGRFRLNWIWFLGHVLRRFLRTGSFWKPFMNLNGNYELMHPFKRFPKCGLFRTIFIVIFGKGVHTRWCWKNAQSWFCTKFCVSFVTLLSSCFNRSIFISAIC
jgi:hypothetical protein